MLRASRSAGSDALQGAPDPATTSGVHPHDAAGLLYSILPALQDWAQLLSRRDGPDNLPAERGPAASRHCCGHAPSGLS